jgi:hypothetical protein
VLKLQEKVLGLEHPDTLRTCFNLAACLHSESETQEANAFAQRAADGARKVLGPERPDTKKYEQLLHEFLAKRVELDRAYPMFATLLASSDRPPTKKTCS